MSHANTLHLNDATAHEFFERGHRLESMINVRRSPEQIDRILPTTRALEPWGLSLTFKKDEFDLEFDHRGTHHRWAIPIINHEHAKRLSWRAENGVPHAGSVVLHQNTLDGTTQVRVVIEYLDEADNIGHAVKEVVGVPAEQFLKGALTRLRQELDAGGADMFQPRLRRLPSENFRRESN